MSDPNEMTYCADHDHYYFGYRGCAYCADAEAKSNVTIEEGEVRVEDVQAEWEEAHAGQLDRLSATIRELKEQLRQIEDGEAIVLPASAPHAHTMIAVARSYLKGQDDD